MDIGPIYIYYMYIQAYTIVYSMPHKKYTEYIYLGLGLTLQRRVQAYRWYCEIQANQNLWLLAGSELPLGLHRPRPILILTRIRSFLQYGFVPISLSVQRPSIAINVPKTRSIHGYEMNCTYSGVKNNLYCIQLNKMYRFWRQIRILQVGR